MDDDLSRGFVLGCLSIRLSNPYCDAVPRFENRRFFLEASRKDLRLRDFCIMLRNIAEEKRIVL